MIYLDNAATTKVNNEVILDIVESLRNDWANPSSFSNQSMEVKRKVEHARKQIADYINAEPEEIIFTASGSEANNLAIKGFMEANDRFDYILTTEIEHPSVYNTVKHMEDCGYNTKYISIDRFGMVETNAFRTTIASLSDIYFCFVSVMMANNEIGTIEPIKEIAKITHRYQGAIHTDATQAFGKIPIDVKDLDVDLMSVSLHKIGLPKGIGFLYKKKNITLSPIIHGGHQEMDMRAGTENTAYIIAAGKQVERIKNRKDSFRCMSKLLINIFDYKNKGIIKVTRNGADFLGKKLELTRLPDNLSVTFEGINAETLITLLDMKGVQVSTGSACSSGEKTPSRVLKAIGLSDEEAFSTIRISIDNTTTLEECDEFLKILEECLLKMKMLGDE